MNKTKTLLASLLLISSVTANATNIDRSEIPEAVFDGIKEDHPNAKNIRVTRQTHFGLTLYEIKFKLHGHPHEALFDHTGEPFGHEEPVKKLPKKIKQSLKQSFAKFKIVEAVSLHHPDGRVEYEIDLRIKNQLWEVVTNEDGKILVKEKI